MSGYFHACPSFAQFGECRCFDDWVVLVTSNGGWWYRHDGVLVEGAGLATGDMLGRPVVNGEIGRTADETAAALGEDAT